MEASAYRGLHIRLLSTLPNTAVVSTLATFPQYAVLELKELLVVAQRLSYDR